MKYLVSDSRSLALLEELTNVLPEEIKKNCKMASLMSDSQVRLEMNSENDGTIIAIPENFGDVVECQVIPKGDGTVALNFNVKCGNIEYVFIYFNIKNVFRMNKTII